MTRPDLVTQLKSLTAEQRLSFYEFLAHELTIAVRAIWSSPDLNCPEIVEQMKQINEVQHRVVAKIRVLRLQTYDWPEEDSWAMLKQAIEREDEKLGGSHIATAVKYAYRNAKSA